MRNWVLAIVGALLIAAGSLLACQVQTSGGAVQVSDVRFPAPGGVTMSGLLYVPKTATAAHPAPAVLVSHGLINTREMQSAFAVELSRRGYVVLAMDMSGHGYSGGVLGQNGAGGPAAFAYLQSQPFVDKNGIGLEGHSLGGVPVLAAARANPDGYRAIVLEGSSTLIGGRGQPGAAPFSPRNIAVVFGRYDEFPTMWGVKRGSEVPTSPVIQGLFGVKEPVVPRRIYGSIAEGTGRLLLLPSIDHPSEHFTKAGVGGALEWFARTLPPTASPKPADDQVWLWKEIGTLVGFIGCVVLILGVFVGLTALPAFAALRQTPQPNAGRRGPRWWLAFILTAAIPALTYFPVMENGSRLFLTPFNWVGLHDFALHTFPEQVTNQLVAWALINAAITFVLSYVLRSGRTAFNHRWGLSLIAAVVSVGAGYLGLVVVDAVCHVDFRFWVLGLKPLDARHTALFLVYLAPFTVFFFFALRAFVSSLPVRREGEVTAAVFGGLAMCLGFIALLAMQYVSMVRTGLLAHDSPLLTIVAYQFVPLLFVVGVIASVTWRRTGSYLSGAFICALFVTWYVVAGTAIYPPTGLGPGGLTASPPAKAAPPAAKTP